MDSMSAKDVVKRFMEMYNCSEQEAIEQIHFLMNHMPRQQKRPAVTGPLEMQFSLDRFQHKGDAMETRDALILVHRETGLYFSKTADHTAKLRNLVS